MQVRPSLVSPDLVRRLCWEWEDISPSRPDYAVEAYLRAPARHGPGAQTGGPILTAALTGAPDAGAQGDDENLVEMFWNRVEAHPGT